MRNNKNAMVALALVAIASMLLAACGGAQPVEVTRIVEVAGTPQVQVVTATPEPVPVEPKVMVVCMAQEPQTLYTLSESALVKAAVLEAVYDWGVDTRSYDYQAVGIKELPSFDNGLATKAEVEVKEGDMVYDAATDGVVPLAAGVVLNQLEGDPITYESGTAKTVQLAVTWTLVDGVTWEDGTPVTTDDIVFAWEVASSPDSPNTKYIIERTASLTAADEKSWTWVSLPGYTSGTYFLDAISNAFVAPLPKHVYGEGGSNPLTPAEMLEDEGVNRGPLAPSKLKNGWLAITSPSSRTTPTIALRKACPTSTPSSSGSSPTPTN